MVSIRGYRLQLQPQENFLPEVKRGSGRTSKTSMDGWWMVQQMVRPVEQMLRTTLHRKQAHSAWDAYHMILIQG